MKKRNWIAVPVAALAALTLLSSCGKKEFRKLQESTTATAGQYVYIKPKLDLVIYQDNSDSLTNSMAILKPQLQSFLAALDTNWEYRVIVMPLLSQQSLSQKYVIATDCTSVTGVGRCLSPSDVGFFNSLTNDAGWLVTRNTQVGNSDRGFQYMNLNSNTLISGGFLRPDSTKAFMVVSDGEDNTNVTYAMRPDGSITGIDYTSATTQSSFNSYLSYFQQLTHDPSNALSPGINLAKFYSVVAANRYIGCNGAPGTTWYGKRYIDLSTGLGGAGMSFDLCNGGLGNVLNDIRSSLHTVVQTVQFNYVVISSSVEPNTSSIVLKKNGATLANSAVDGWTYVGMRTGPTSDYPTVGNVRTGYMVQLNGNAKFKGTDTIEIVYTPK